MDYLTLALVLVLVGVVLLGAEVLLPTGGILVVGALLCFAVGVGTILYYGTVLEAAVALAGLAVGLPASGFAAVAAWRRMSIGRALDPGAAATAVDVPQLARLDELRGRVGKTVTPMRPSGSVAFDGRRVDALTEGMMLDAGVWVRCVEAKAGRVVVRQIDPPADLSDVTPGGGLPAAGPDRPPDIDLDFDLDRPQ
jgi:membrane-bound serine protease (ClpP class)